MSRTRPDRVDVVLLDYACERCGAAPGDWCISNPDGLRRWALYLHVPRFTRAREDGRLPLPGMAGPGQVGQRESARVETEYRLTYREPDWPHHTCTVDDLPSVDAVKDRLWSIGKGTEVLRVESHQIMYTAWVDDPEAHADIVTNPTHYDIKDRP